jgi:AcrR family transcriptional regulator
MSPPRAPSRDNEQVGSNDETDPRGLPAPVRDSPKGVSESRRKRRPVGRPRRLTLNQIIDAALEIGLGSLTMTNLAEHLGVGIGLLYSYVASRDELVQLAAARAAQQHPFPEDEGQPWHIYVFEQARALYESVIGERGQPLATFLEGGMGPEVHIDFAERFMAALMARGFNIEEAMKVLRGVRQITAGAASGAIHVRATKSVGKPYTSASYTAVLARPEGDLPVIKSILPEFADELTITKWEDTLELYLRGLAAARGESLGATRLVSEPKRRKRK